MGMCTSRSYGAGQAPSQELLWCALTSMAAMYARGILTVLSHLQPGTSLAALATLPSMPYLHLRASAEVDFLRMNHKDAAPNKHAWQACLERLSERPWGGSLLHDPVSQCEAFMEARSVTCCTQIRWSWTMGWTSST